MTNYERIKNMSVEEMGELLIKRFYPGYEFWNTPMQGNMMRLICEWLNQEEE